MTTLLAALTLTGTATAHAEPAKGDRLQFLETRIGHHTYVCRNGRPKHRNTRWHCAALQWATREHHEALEARMVGLLNRGLAGTPMAGLGTVLVEEGRAANINPFFMAAAAGTESSFGAAACSGNPRNVWGLSSCGSGWHVPYFGTWREAIRFYARFLAERWPSATSPYHYYGYAACDQCWGRKTAWWMTSRFGVPPYTRFR